MASRVEWALWANEQALMSGGMLVIGGLVAVVEECELWGLSAVGLCLGSLVSLIEYPRGAKVGKEKVDDEGAQRPRQDTRAQRREDDEAAPRRAPAGEPKRRPRRAQELLERLVDALGMVTTSYYSRALLYTTMSIPCGFTLSTFLGSISLFLASLLYLRAAVAGESWVSGRAGPRPERRVAACFTHIQRQLSSVTWRLGPSGTDDDAAEAVTPIGASERTPLLAP